MSTLAKRLMFAFVGVVMIVAAATVVIVVASSSRVSPVSQPTGKVAARTATRLPILQDVHPEDLSPARTSPPPTCSPAPCAAFRGLVARFANLARAWSPPPAGRFAPPPATPNPGFHFVRIEVSFEAQLGEHTVGAAQVRLRDALGYAHEVTACTSKYDTTTIAAPARLGPIPLCFEAGGSVEGPLALLWYPGISPFATQLGTPIVISLD